MTNESNRVQPRSAAFEPPTQAKSGLRHPRAHALSTGDPGEHVDVESLVPGIDAAIAAPMPVDADPDGGDDQNESGSSTHAALDPTQGEAPRQLDIRLQRVGVTIANLCKQAHSQTSWHARIPLDPQLLAGTVLHLAYSPTMMTVRFETTEWSAREVLLPRVSWLEQILVDMLPSSCQVFVSVT
jgi:hypothetical protein